MTNTMPMLTDSEREMLAGLAKIEIRRWDKAAESVPEKKYMAELMQIAWAALTTKPSAYITVQGGCRAPDDCEFYHELSEKEDLSCNGTPAFPVYEAPPVPALKLPDEMQFVSWHPDCGYEPEQADGVKAGFNCCLEQIKRMNGVTE